MRSASPLGRLLVLATLLLVAGLIGLLAWGMVRSGGKPGGIGINSSLGEVPAKQEPAREISLLLFDGTTVTMAGLRGKVVMVDFWASWCPPCREEAPALAQVYREFQEKGVEFVGVAVWDSDEEARAYVSKYGITYPSGLDAKGTIAIDYGVAGIPEKYFISRDGLVAKRFIGPMTADKLREVLNALLSASQ